MVSTPLENISQLGLLFPIYGQKKNVVPDMWEWIKIGYPNYILDTNQATDRLESVVPQVF